MDAYGSSLALLGLHLNGAGANPWDGTIDSWSGNPPWNSWDPDTAARLAIPTDVTIGLSGTAGATPDEWHITAHVCVEPGGTGRSMRIYIA